MKIKTNTKAGGLIVDRLRMVHSSSSRFPNPPAISGCSCPKTCSSGGLPTGGRQRHEAELVHDQQILPGQMFLPDSCQSPSAC
jgi:hypothetical protein